MAEWDMRTNFKNKPESQGTLFQGGRDQLNPQRRYPRGYTPQRQREVSDALPTAYTSSYKHRAQVVDSVSRSSIPTEDLAGLNEVHDRPDEGTSGTYWTGSKKIGVDMDHPDAHQSLIHEIGHHVDQRGNHFGGGYGKVTESLAKDAAHTHAVRLNEKRGKDAEPNDTEVIMAGQRVMRGVSEAVADDYMVKNYSTGGRNPKGADQGLYQRNFEPGDIDARYPGYSDVRPHRNLGAQWHQEGLF